MTNVIIENKNKYKCHSCSEVVEIDSTKKRIKAYCDISGEYVKLQLLK